MQFYKNRNKRSIVIFFAFGYKEKQCDENRHDFRNNIFLSVFSDPRRTQEWYERTAKDLGVMVKQEYPRTAEEARSNLGCSYFPEFDYSKHTCEPVRIPEDWTIYRRTFTRL